MFKKMFILIYGTIAYVIFLAAFLYAIFFVGDFLVPKTINSGPDTDFTQAILINLALLSLFALQHSIMARPAFKRWWTKLIHSSIERSTYVLLSSLALFLIYWQWQPMHGIIWEVQHETTASVIHGIFFLGWLIVLLSTFMINHFDLFGLKQIYESLKNMPPQPVPFKIKAFYRLVRHPIMLGFIIAFWATPVMTIGHLVFAVTTTLYILVAVKFLEEKDLKKIHGRQYESYQQEVPMLIPFTKGKNA